jgi:flavorubredoxin
MISRDITKNVLYLGVIDWDRRLFDELIPLPDGTSYNSFLIKGSDKTALIDTVDPSYSPVFLDTLDDLDIEHLDYVVINHAEQDHSGSLPFVLKKFPEAQVVTNQKCKNLLMEMLLIPEEKFIIAEDRTTLSLGDKTLEFIFCPWVHWPETMITYLHEDKILFTCDFFGSHLATSDLFVTNESVVYEAAKRYYAEIMMPFKIPIRKNIEKIQGLQINIIAPSHGPLYNYPMFILDAYRDWVSDRVENQVIIGYVSMHDSTHTMVKYLVDVLIRHGITVKQFDLATADIGKFAMALVDATTIILASPTTLGGAHPLAVYAAYLVNALRPKAKYASIIGSFGWGGKMLDQLKGLLSNLNIDFLNPVIIKGYPKRNDFESLEKLGLLIKEKHSECELDSSPM